MKTPHVVLAGLVAAGIAAAADARADGPPPGAPQLALGQHFSLDPVADGALTAVGFGFSGLLGLVLSTGEIKPPSPAVDSSGLLTIDRIAVTQRIDRNAGTLSDVGLYGAVAFAAIDPLLSGVRDGWDAALVDGFMYAESISLTLTLTDATKIAVRRPRPIDYVNCGPSASSNGNTPSGCNNTDLGLSFFSGHAAMVAAVGGTATYIAFVRSPGTPRPWITLAAATLLTAFVGYERVRSGEHFPTDVIAGAMAGAAVGVLVPHLHRHKEEGPPVWVGFAPTPRGASVTLEARF
jgi:undecaprenyl-diphosphatase